MDKLNESVDRPPLTARFKAALVLQNHSVSSWARSRGWHVSNVWATLSGERTYYPDILAAIAEVVGEDVSDVAAEIAGATESAA